LKNQIYKVCEEMDNKYKKRISTPKVAQGKKKPNNNIKRTPGTLLGGTKKPTPSQKQQHKKFPSLMVPKTKEEWTKPTPP
jgi:hypothetical protein